VERGDALANAEGCAFVAERSPLLGPSGPGGDVGEAALEEDCDCSAEEGGDMRGTGPGGGDIVPCEEGVGAPRERPRLSLSDSVSSCC